MNTSGKQLRKLLGGLDTPALAMKSRILVEPSLAEAAVSYKSKPMREWVRMEVAAFLHSVQFGEYAPNFIAQHITGDVLPTLTEQDMQDLGISKIGHRKKLSKDIAKLQTVSELELPIVPRTPQPMAQDTSSSSGSQESERPSKSTITMKVNFGDERKTIQVPYSIKYRDLRRKLQGMFSVEKLKLRFKDEGGDFVEIRRQQDLADLMKDTQMSGANKVSIYCASVRRKTLLDRESVLRQKEEMFMVFDAILDPVMAINDEGAIQYLNKATEDLTGYTSKELVGQNVKMLMPQEYAESHDTYMQAYLKTRVAKIIGFGRDVPLVKKDNSIITIHLQKIVNNRQYFFGALKKVQETQQPKPLLLTEREVVDHLIVPGIIIDPKGIICGFNQAAQKFFGYSLVEVVGKNVSILMSSADSAMHDTYLERYRDTGRTTIIGSGRKVIAQAKDGTLKAAFLSVTEKREGNVQIFTGIIQDTGI